MSYTETHFGKLRRVDLEENQSIEDWCKMKCNEEGKTELPSYFENWEELFRDAFYDKFFIVNGAIWETFEHTEVEEGDGVEIVQENSDGTLSFVMQFYNGGTCLSECIEDGIKRIG